MSATPTQDTPGVDYSFNVTAQNRPMYKATLAIAIVYGVAILVVIILANLPGGQILVGEFYPFTLTFVLGMIIVLIAMTLTLMTSNKPAAPPKIEMVEAGYKCPDYYELQNMDDTWMTTNINDTLLGGHKARLKKACVMKTGYSNYFGSNNYHIITESRTDNLNAWGTDSTGSKKIFVNSAVATHSKPAAILGNTVFYKLTNQIKPGDSNITCRIAFPDYFEYIEGSNVSGARSNELRCKYAELCGVTWSSLQCDQLQ